MARPRPRITRDSNIEFIVDKSGPRMVHYGTRYDEIARALGGYAELVEQPGDIRPALERAAAAVAGGKSALVNVVTDWSARATTAAFTVYST